MSERQTVKQPKRTRRTFNSEFKVRAVKMNPAHDHRACEAARLLDIKNLWGRWEERLSASVEGSWNCLQHEQKGKLLGGN